MFSGKTSALIRDASSTPNALVIDYDTSMSSGMLESHDHKRVKCITTSTLMSLNVESSIIFINEGQFFEDLVEFVKLRISLGDTVYVYGLDGDFKQETFGRILELIPFADTYIKLYATCNVCNRKASFSKRMSSNTSQYAPEDTYIPVCRMCLKI